ncbi:MAG: right-handed parallel beta-helix repeat-containing protein, partial [Planctomycetota bacterium]
MANSSSNPTVTNCTFSGNRTDSSGGGMANSSSNPTVTNCTFSGNRADSSGGGMTNSSSNPTVTNCIFWGDMPNEIDNSAGSTPLVSYSDVQGSGGSGAWDPSVGTDGGGNIDGDPLFANPAGGNLRLLRHSPCTDAGNTPAVPPGVFTDLAGNPRFVDDASVPDTGVGNPCVDMGAYERQSDSAGPVTVPADFVTIQAAIDWCIDGEEILVAPGTYFESINFWGKAITLRSSDGPDATVIDPQGSGSGVRCESGEGLDTILDGFTIRGGSTGMYNSGGSSPTVANCTFSGNTAATGGGMYNYFDSGPTVTDCTFSGNSSTYGGGGMANVLNSNPTVTNCTFSGNTAGDDPSSGDGGGMYNQESSPTLINCVFSDNSALN